NEDEAVISAYELKANDLKNQILANFYNKEKNEFSYIIDHNGSLHNYQEASGISFAVIFGVLEGGKAHQLINNAKVSRYGITSVYPDFPRFSAEKPGRHNNIIWPVVNGYFAQAASLTGNYEKFTNELFSLTHLALDEDKGNYNFREIYIPLSGKPDGGYQGAGASDPDHHWESCKLQTWSATAYINMVHNGLAGFRINNDKILFSPYLPESIHYLELKNIQYHQAKLDIVIKGNGKNIKTFLLNGKKQSKHSIASNLKGSNKITIEME
ncbi:MAG: MGH1-like glycoside hydrolase domain-containing protein, partial [Syntrophothermus sp.]